MEETFFNYLLTYLRDNNVNAFFHLPLKVVYPSVCMEHKSTHVFDQKEIIQFSMICYHDQVRPDALTSFVRKLSDLLEKTDHYFCLGKKRGVLKIEHTQQVPHEYGKKSEYHMECTALVRNT